MKIDLETVEATLLEKKIDNIKVQEIIKELTVAVEEEKEERAANSGPKAKWEHIIVLNDPDGNLITGEVMGWVVQQRQGEDAGKILANLCDAAKAQNETAKRKKNLISSFVDLFGALKSKFLKEKNLRIKTKEAVRVLVVNNKLV
jgi:uncharacterized protein (UPF0371 family)